MSVGPLVVDILATFIIAAVVLYHYGNWQHHHLMVTFSVLIAWYFSMLIVFILPMDVSNTLYETCLNSQNTSVVTEPPFRNETDTNATVPTSTPMAPVCPAPWSFVPVGVFPVFWRVVYWTSQILTWLILPLMQSYTKAGDFTFGFKLRSALIDNAIYYGSYLLIAGVLLLYIALRPDVHLDGSKLRTIAASASNTWGLFWLVLLLGYGLVEVPRSIWHSASTHHTINHAYFKAAKLFHERAEVEDHLNDLLQSTKALGDSMSPTHPLRHCMDIIESKIPAELLDRMRGMRVTDSPRSDVASEKALVRIHKQLLKALQHFQRVETQWVLLMSNIVSLEDHHRSAVGVERIYHHSFPPNRPSLVMRFFTPRIEWYWRCWVWKYLVKATAVFCGLVSATVMWSELTFFVKEPPLTLFANVVRWTTKNDDYFTMEVFSTLMMAYIALCAYSTLFKIRVLNLYYLAPHHLTDEYSLIFSGMMMSRLTPPMCLNFLSLIHMDSHVIDNAAEETHYTQVMGHMDVVSIISDGFNVYFPMMIVALCLATYYHLGSRLLSALGFQQFIGDDDLTSDLIEEGKTIANREVRKRQRVEESEQRRREFSERFRSTDSTGAGLYRFVRNRPESRERSDGSGEIGSPQRGLLGNSEHVRYSHFSSLSSPTDQESRDEFDRSRPDRGLFDDI